jgi:hypothetical protein
MSIALIISAYINMHIYAQIKLLYKYKYNNFALPQKRDVTGNL